MKKLSLALLASSLTFFNAYSEDSLKDKIENVSHNRKRFAEKIDRHNEFVECIHSSKKGDTKEGRKCLKIFKDKKFSKIFFPGVLRNIAAGRFLKDISPAIEKRLGKMSMEEIVQAHADALKKENNESPFAREFLIRHFGEAPLKQCADRESLLLDENNAKLNKQEEALLQELIKDEQKKSFGNNTEK